jgi:chaperonin GroES
MKIKPILDRVLIERDKPDDTTSGGIVLPNDAKKESNRGTVLAVGPGAERKNGTIKPVSVKVGDKVLFSDYHITQDEKIAGDKIIVDEEDILAVIIEDCEN